MLKQAASRFYEFAKSEACDGGFHITLDDRIVNTPLGAALIVPSQSLALEIAAEWQAQDEKIVPDTMHMMRLACTALDKVSPNRATVIDQGVDYGGNDLLCYMAEAPDDLVERQKETWQPLLDWVDITYGARLRTAHGILHVAQTDPSLSSLRKAIEQYDNFELTGLTEVTQILGSLVLGLAVTANRLTWQDAFEASQLDETWQNERWGQDHEARHRIENRKLDTEMAARFLELI